MLAGLGPSEWACDECSLGLPAVQKGSRVLTGKHTQLQAGASTDGPWEEPLGQEDHLGAGLQARALLMACLLPSLCRRLRPAPSPLLSRGGPGNKPLAFPAPSSWHQVPRGPSRKSVNLSPAAGKPLGCATLQGPWGAAPSVAQAPPASPRLAEHPGWVPLASPAPPAPLGPTARGCPRLGPTGVPAPAPLGPGPPSCSRVEQAS